MTQLVCVAADKNIEAALSALLEHRRPALGLSSFSFQIVVHPRRDPGCYHNGPEFLRDLLGAGETLGLLVFDQTWSGNTHATAVKTETAVRKRFDQIGITQRANVVVIGPEIEAWVWSASPYVDEVLGWNGAQPMLRQWLTAQGFWPNGVPKPPDPKVAMEEALFRQRVPRSSALYRQLARQVSLNGCQDPAFQRFRDILRRWFPSDQQGGF